MGNCSYISFNRAVSDEQFTDMLSDVITANYSKFYKVEYKANPGQYDGPCWVIRLKSKILSTEDGYEEDKLEKARNHWSFYIWRARNFSAPKNKNEEYPFYKGKFEHGYLGPLWGSWFANQFHGHLSQTYKSRTGDESAPGVEKINPTVCPTYKQWLVKHFPSMATNPQMTNLHILEIPKKLRELQD